MRVHPQECSSSSPTLTVPLLFVLPQSTQPITDKPGWLSLWQDDKPHPLSKFTQELDPVFNPKKDRTDAQRYKDFAQFAVSRLTRPSGAHSLVFRHPFREFPCPDAQAAMEEGLCRLAAVAITQEAIARVKARYARVAPRPPLVGWVLRPAADERALPLLHDARADARDARVHSCSAADPLRS